MTVLFISDLHLSEREPNLLSLFDRFAERYVDSQCEAVYVLGDLFDAWIGDDFRSGGIDLSVAILKKIAAKCPLFFIHGNRDFLIGEQFAKLSGMTLLPEHHVLTLGGENVLIMHGDTLCTDDHEYMSYRAMVRDKSWQQAVMQLSIEERLAKAQALRAESQQAANSKDDEIMDVNDKTVVEAMTRYDCQKLIHGHTHRPNIHQFQLDGKPATRAVLSDWHADRGNFLSYEKGEANLHYFSL